MRDAVKKGRRRGPSKPGWQVRKTHCPKGHPFDEANTIIVKGHHRRCRACSAEYVRNWKRVKRDEKKKAAINAALSDTRDKG
jgi:hypothetical protein